MQRLALLAFVLLVVPTQADTPKEPIQLFNGKDLTNFYTYVRGEGKNKDRDKVFTVANGNIHISGQHWGGLTTEKEWENYHIIVEFKWGTKTWPPREKATMDSGLLVHCVGEDGAAGGAWMESIECQMIEGGTGDFILVKGKGKVAPSLTCPVVFKETKSSASRKAKEAYYDPKGTPKKFSGGRINWYARAYDWADVKGFRGKDDVEHPAGEWNKLECICDGDKITNILNGKVVNAGIGASLTKGKIILQSEGAELFIRKIELRPVKK